MEKQNLFNFVHSMEKNQSVRDVFISLPVLTEDAETEIRSLAEAGDIQIMLYCVDLEDFDARFGKNVLALKGDANSGITLMTGNAIYRGEELIFPFNEACYTVEFLHRQEDNCAEALESIRQLYAEMFISDELDKYEELLQKEGTSEIVERIDELNSADSLVLFPDRYAESTGNGERLTGLRAQRDEQLLQLVQNYSNDMLEELGNIRTSTPLDEIVTLEAMDEAKSAFSDFKGKMIPEQSTDYEKGWGCSGAVLALNDSIRFYKSQLENRETYLRQELLPKSYIIDTNVFVLFPEIMDYIGKEDKIVLSVKVLDELDKLKVTLDGKDKRNVKKAIKEIHNKINMKSRNFFTDSADTGLLPADFDKTNADNMILSVALKYKKRNPFMVTNDIKFQSRAASVGIPYKGLVDLLPEEVFGAIDISKSAKKEPEPKKPHASAINKDDKPMPKPLLEMMKNAYKACGGKSGEVLVAKLVSEIKSVKSDFKPSDFGFQKFKDLCAAYPSEVHLYENSNKALCIRMIGAESE